MTSMFISRVLFLFTILHFIPVISILGQTPNFNFEKLTTSAGLSNNTVHAIIEDDLGFIWVGTKSGLNRYDGYEFKNVKVELGDNSTASSLTVYSLLMDQNKVMWIGLRDLGLIAYDRANHSFQSFPFDENSTVDWSTITVRSIFEDSRSWLWIGTFGGGAIVLDEHRKVKYHFCTYCNEEKQERLSNDFVFDFEEDIYGNVYIATAGKGLNVFQVGEGSIEQISSPFQEDMNSFSKTLCLDNSNRLWVGTEGSGLYSLDISKGIWQSYKDGSSSLSIEDKVVRDIQLDRNGNLWVATDGGGLYEYNSESSVFQNFRYDAEKFNALNTNALYTLHMDTRSNLWIGTFNGGVNLLKAIQAPFYRAREYDKERKLGLRSVLSVAEDDQARVWLGSDGAGLFYFDAEGTPLELKNAASLLKQGKFNDVITCIEPNGDQGIWYGSYAEGLTYYDFQTGSITTYLESESDSTSLAHNNVWDLEMDKKGGLWIGTLGGGIDYLPSSSSAFQHFKGPLSDVQIVDILVDQRNQYLWIATENNGLNRLNLQARTLEYFDSEGLDGKDRLSSNNLLGLFEDKMGFIWVVSDIGLDKINPETSEVSRVNFSHRFSLGNIYNIEEDKEGFIWIATSKGIDRLDTKDNTIIELGFESVSNNIYNARAGEKLEDGRILFGGVEGFSLIEPSALQFNDHNITAVFTSLKIGNSEIEIGRINGRVILNKDLNSEDAEVRLNYQDRSILFEISTTEYIDPERNKYAYRLEGFDDEWTYVESSQRDIFYSSLKGGKYRLQIKATNSSGVWSDKIRSLDIVVKPPIWETSWFILLTILLLGCIIFYIYRFLLNRQKEIYEKQALQQQQELLRKEQEILQLQNINLEEEISNKKAELSASILQVAHKNEFLTVLKGRISKIKSEADESAAKPLRSVVNIINSELRQEDYWEQFQLIFNQTFQDFIKKLEVEFPVLTSNDHRLCCFIKMKLNNREIASILNITLSAVEQAKYRLKKKIGLQKAESLYDFIQNFSEVAS